MNHFFRIGSIIMLGFVFKALSPQTDNWHIAWCAIVATIAIRMYIDSSVKE